MLPSLLNYRALYKTAAVFGAARIAIFQGVPTLKEARTGALADHDLDQPKSMAVVARTVRNAKLLRKRTTPGNTAMYCL